MTVKKESKKKVEPSLEDKINTIYSNNLLIVFVLDCVLLVFVLLVSLTY